MHPLRRTIESRTTYVVCTAFVIGAAANDGFTRWVLGVPFAVLLVAATASKDVPFAPRKRTLLCTSIIFVLSFWLVMFRWESSLVYPSIGAKLTVQKTLAISKVPRDRNGIGGHAYREQINGKPRNDEYASTGFDAAVGTRWRVFAVHPGNPSLGLSYEYGLKEVDGDRTFWVPESALINIHRPTAFCAHVKFLLCESAEWTSPMRFEFKLLSGLYYLPAMLLLALMTLKIINSELDKPPE